jgi:cytochrome c oxidase subunit 2
LMYKIIKDFGWNIFNKLIGIFKIYFMFPFLMDIVFSVTYLWLCLIVKLYMLLNKLYNLFNNIYKKELSDLFEEELVNGSICWLKNLTKEEFVKFFRNYSSIYLYTSYPAYGYLDLELDSNDDFLTVQSFKHSSRMEYVFAAFPTIIIIYILVPSLFLLYSLDEDLDPKMTIKVVGHQWFWNYEYELYADDLNGTFVLYNDSFDSVLIQESELKFGAKRLLEVDKRLILPINVTLRFVITSTDVLHSWSIPEMGIKVDAVPGRLNQFISLINRPGVFYGQCSELCGVAHGFMPIVVHAVPYEIFLDYLNN